MHAFGEELGRINFGPLPKRRKYVGAMVDHALRHGVKLEKPALGVTP